MYLHKCENDCYHLHRYRDRHRYNIWAQTQAKLAGMGRGSGKGRGRHRHRQPYMQLQPTQKSARTNIPLSILTVTEICTIVVTWTVSVSSLHDSPYSILATHPHNHEPLGGQCVLIHCKVSGLSQQQVHPRQAVLVVEYIVRACCVCLLLQTPGLVSHCCSQVCAVACEATKLAKRAVRDFCAVVNTAKQQGQEEKGFYAVEHRSGTLGCHENSSGGKAGT